MSWVAALLFALAAPSGIIMATPVDSGPVSLAVIEIQPGGTFLNFLQFPPTDAHPEGERASLVEHQGAVVERVLAGPRLPARIAIREVYPEMPSMRRSAMRKLAFLERAAGGYWHAQWDRMVVNGRACLDAEAIAHFRIVVPRRTPDRNGEICFNL